MIQLIPQASVDLQVVLMAVVDIHTPEAEAIHDLTESVVIVVKFNGSHDIENDLGISAHIESVDGTWALGDIVTRLALPGVPSNIYQYVYGETVGKSR